MWIRLVTLKTKSQNEKDLVKVFSSNFKNNYSKAREELIRLRDTHNDLVRYSSINLCVEHVGKLSEAINGNFPSIDSSINDWLELPERLEASKNKTPFSLALSLARIASENFDLKEALDNSISEGNFAIAEVLLREQRKVDPLRREINEFESKIRKKRNDFKKDLESKIEVVKSLIDDAYEHSIIDDASRSSLYVEIEGARGMGDEENPRYPESNEALKNIKNLIGLKKENTLKDWEKKFKEI